MSQDDVQHASRFPDAHKLQADSTRYHLGLAWNVMESSRADTVIAAWLIEYRYSQSIDNILRDLFCFEQLQTSSPSCD